MSVGNMSLHRAILHQRHEQQWTELRSPDSPFILISSCILNSAKNKRTYLRTINGQIRGKQKDRSASSALRVPSRQSFASCAAAHVSIKCETASTVRPLPSKFGTYKTVRTRSWS